MTYTSSHYHLNNIHDQTSKVIIQVHDNKAQSLILEDQQALKFVECKIQRAKTDMNIVRGRPLIKREDSRQDKSKQASLKLRNSSL